MSAISYELASLKDVFSKVPKDKIALCMRELAILMQQGRALQDLMEGIDGIEYWPEKIIWIDDDKGTVGFDLICEKTIIASIRKDNA